MKKITSKNIKDGYKWCDYCKEKVLAVHKSHMHKACEYHKIELEKIERSMFEKDSTAAREIQNYLRKVCL